MNLESTVASADGTTIAFERFGSGDPVILIGGALRSPIVTPELAEHLGTSHTAVYYDRRGRGKSGDTPPYVVDREIEDLAALIDTVGGTAALYGHSSGSGLALQAVTQGLPVTRLVLHDPPFASDDAERSASRTLAEKIKAAVAEDRRADALDMFLSSMGLPAEVVEQMSSDKESLAVAHTIPYDYDVLDDGTPSRPRFIDQAAGVTIPALALASPSSFATGMCKQLVAALPNGTFQELDHEEMFPPPATLAAAIAALLDA